MSVLDRATPGYARGYRDCRDNRPKLYENDGTFLGHDYHEGWWACWNELYWDAVREDIAYDIERDPTNHKRAGEVGPTIFNAILNGRM